MEFLHRIQEAYNFDHSRLIEDYRALLIDVERSLRRRASNPEFKWARKRKIFSLDKNSFGTPEEQGKVDYVTQQRRFLETKVASKLAKVEDWRTQVRAITEYLNRSSELDNLDEFGIYNFFRYSEHRKFAPTNIDPISARDILGFPDNVRNVYSLLRVFAQGHKVPNIALIGREGVGKTMTLRYAANSIENLKVVMISSSQLHDLESVVEKISEKPYQVLICVDDLHFQNPDSPYDRWTETLKTVTSGVKEMPKNVMIGISINPEPFDKL